MLLTAQATPELFKTAQATPELFMSEIVRTPSSQIHSCYLKVYEMNNFYALNNHRLRLWLFKTAQATPELFMSEIVRTTSSQIHSYYLKV